MRGFVAIAVLVALAPSLATAQGLSMKPDDIIAARQGGMALTGG